ncbi:hypothetical protein BYT27DRAFT_6752177 [Phlegmacium glaucopus]|nr:hypothetical protein BYT27DRAFT_6752177 [Phlegmacium glaucopus]
MCNALKCHFNPNQQSTSSSNDVEYSYPPAPWFTHSNISSSIYFISTDLKTGKDQRRDKDVWPKLPNWFLPGVRIRSDPNPSIRD